MLLRVRSKMGTWRVEGVEPGTTIKALRSRILSEHGVSPHPSQVFSLDPAGKRVMDDEQTVKSFNLQHGDLVHLAIREEDCAHEAGKKIAADGSIVNKTHLEASRVKGFRPGMMSLRSMKMHWTLTDFVELDAQFEYKIKAQKNETPWCTKAIMEPICGNDFQVCLCPCHSFVPIILSAPPAASSLELPACCYPAPFLFPSLAPSSRLCRHSFPLFRSAHLFPYVRFAPCPRLEPSHASWALTGMPLPVPFPPPVLHAPRGVQPVPHGLPLWPVHRSEGGEGGSVVRTTSRK